MRSIFRPFITQICQKLPIFDILFSPFPNECNRDLLDSTTHIHKPQSKASSKIRHDLLYIGFLYATYQTDKQMFKCQILLPSFIRTKPYWHASLCESLEKAQTSCPRAVKAPPRAIDAKDATETIEGYLSPVCVLFRVGPRSGLCVCVVSVAALPAAVPLS